MEPSSSTKQKNAVRGSSPTTLAIWMRYELTGKGANYGRNEMLRSLGRLLISPLRSSASHRCEEVDLATLARSLSVEVKNTLRLSERDA